MIIDAFIFYNELDLLELRLEELYPVVDKFLIVQAYHTFRGIPKPVFFDKKDERWAKYRDKIDTVTIGLSGGKDAWEREAFQRNIISTQAKDAYAPDDILIISDVDEIPRREIVADAERMIAHGPARLEMKMYYYKLNVRKGDWHAAKMLHVRDVTTAEEVRHTHYDPIVYGAGWHFSYLGDEEFIANKLKAFSHSELDTPEIHAGIAEAVAERKDLFGRDDLEFAVEAINDSWPNAVKNNPDFWSKYVWH